MSDAPDYTPDLMGWLYPISYFDVNENGMDAQVESLPEDFSIERNSDGEWIASVTTSDIEKEFGAPDLETLIEDVNDFLTKLLDFVSEF